MKLYEEYCLPYFIDRACSAPPISRHRQSLVPQAKGRVLEVGMGSGINLQHYNTDSVEFVWALEPSQGMRKRAQKNLAQSPIEVKWLDLPGEEIPLDNNSVDTVLLTYTLCSIPDWQRALEQMRRVLKPGGELLFSEHGTAPDPAIQKWQDRLNPVWKAFGGGCHLNRPIDKLLQQSGFEIKQLDTEYMNKVPKFVGYNYRGMATSQ